MVLLDYLMTVTFLPAVVVLHHRKCRRCDSRRRCCKRGNPAPLPEAPKPTGGDGGDVELPYVNPSFTHESDRTSHGDTSTHNASTASDAESSVRWMERKFAGPYSTATAKHSDKVVVLSLIFLAFAGAFAFEVLPMKEDPAQLPDSHHQERAKWIRGQIGSNGGQATLETEWAFIVYGIVPEDTGFSLDPTSEGTVVFDDTFDISDPAAQSHLLHVCEKLLDTPHLVRRVASCWLFEFRDYVVERGQTFPVPSADFHSMMRDFVLQGPGHNFLEWSMQFTDQRGIYLGDVEPYSCQDCAGWEEEAFAEGRLLSMHIDVETTMPEDLTVDELLPWYDEWEAFMAELNADAPPSAANGYQTSGVWIFMSTIDDLAKTGSQAILLSLVVAYVVLIVATQNIVVATFGIISLLGIVATVVALIGWSGNRIGVLESIAMSIVVGLSVDVSAHLGNAYSVTDKSLKRVERAQLAARHLGISVTMGAITTACSGTFLLFSTLLFFQRFGFFLTSTALTSLGCGLGIFMGLLFLFGPEGNTGELSELLRICSRRGSGDAAPHAPSVNESSRKLRASKKDDELAGVDLNQDPAARKRAAIAAAVVILVFVIARAVVPIGDGASDDEASPAVSAEPFMNITFPETKLPEDSTTYLCSGFGFPEEEVWATGFTAIETIDTVHHMVLFKMDTLPASCPHSCFDMPDARGVLFSWAVGGDPFVLPDGVGLALGGRRGARAASLQIHYSNPLHRQDTMDTGSGLQLTLTSVKPQYFMTTMMVGFHPASPAVVIPGGQSATQLTTTCYPTLRGPVNVFAYFLHAHLIGRRIVAEQLRDGEVIESLGIDPFYDFNLQRTLPFPDGRERILQPGDGIRITCTYDSTEYPEGTSVYGGFASEQEMCVAFFPMYPEENVGDSFCLTY